VVGRRLQAAASTSTSSNLGAKPESRSCRRPAAVSFKLSAGSGEVASSWHHASWTMLLSYSRLQEENEMQIRASALSPCTSPGLLYSVVLFSCTVRIIYIYTYTARKYNITVDLGVVIRSRGFRVVTVSVQSTGRPWNLDHDHAKKKNISVAITKNIYCILFIQKKERRAAAAIITRTVVTPPYFLVPPTEKGHIANSGAKQKKGKRCK
jgi:hypothetical protein